MGHCDDWRAAQDSARGQWVETRKKKCAEEKDQGYNKCAKEEDQGYNKCAKEEDQGYNKCTEEKDKGYSKCSEEKDKGHNECCTWWPCSWACDALVWVSNIVCVAWTWVSNVVCVVWTWIKNMVCVLWTWIKNMVCVLWTWVSNVVCVLWTWTVDVAWRAKTWVGTATCKVADFFGGFVGGVAAWVEKRFGERPEFGKGPCNPGPWEPKSALAHAVVAAGFFYDPRQDIIYSRMEPLQREFGYAYGYDAAAFAMNAIIDCEPIFFDYAGKSWMIELWKGQYGLQCGCEIGVYNRAPNSPPYYALLDSTIGVRPGDTNPSHNLFFDCASNSELLTMEYTLFRNGNKLLCRGPQPHWWLTGFKWGVLSEPTDLTMDVSITGRDAVMTSAIETALNAMGYSNVLRNGNTLQFTFDTPKTRQPRVDWPRALLAGVRAANQEINAAYNRLGLTNNDPNTIPEAAMATIGRAFAIFSGEFFTSVTAEAVTKAGATLGEWIDGLANFIDRALDFSCVVEISNVGGPHELVLDDSQITDGEWAVPPPERIPPGGTGRFWLKDPKPSVYGSQGSATYSWVDSSGSGQTSTFSFADPTTGSNAAASSSSDFGLYTKSGDVNSAWSARNSVVTTGHPFFVAFVWGTGPPPP